MMTGKNLLFLLLFIPLMSIGQSINKTNDGYTEVVEVELTKQQIHQKLNEWIAFTYKSANDVVQLNTEDKIILKGNFRVNLQVTTTKKFVFGYIISNSLSFSIRDNKYKIDLIPSGVSSSLDGADVGVAMVSQFIMPEMTKDEHLEMVTTTSKEAWLNYGYSEKKAQKMLDKYTLKNIDKTYADYIVNKSIFKSEIELFFDSAKNYVTKTNSDDDDW